ncbi:2-amino-4-hydroxy-6-hydroxymethyldihydropteridine diphosphokinase [Sulfurivermis fontis]|uniref:2-amino-4-hydroxy-6- hydroxymethyldihydropteridine diphosphokinase n=1 Tax=Sulfurivermis fontis TaxID=1972068 RepID=UPI000FD96D85|nr:2-amino-4-hydroxy-6-hydroxymethyldihydropteridine diphosphokinase [Sulfurivermis fontis]
MAAVRAYIGLGSNLDNPAEQLRRALTALAGIPDTRLAACSRFYRSAPLGPQDQPDYVNAVAALDTGLAPEALLDALQAIETAQGRVRLRRWGPRTLDLDILLYGDTVLATPRLSVPHPGLAERSFVLYPLAELVPDLLLPDGRRLADLLRQCDSAGLEPLADGGGDAGVIS